MNLALNGNKTNIGLVVAGLGYLFGHAGQLGDSAAMTGAEMTEVAGVLSVVIGAGHKVYKHLRG